MSGLGSCVPKYIPNCRFHHYSAYPTATGCELCEKGFRVVYTEPVDGKRFGRCESPKEEAIPKCWLYRTNQDDNSFKCYVCEENQVPNDEGSACRALTSSEKVKNCEFHRNEGGIECKYCKTGFNRKLGECINSSSFGCLRTEDDGPRTCKECNFLERYFAVDHDPEVGAVCKKKAYLFERAFLALSVILFLTI